MDWYNDWHNHPRHKHAHWLVFFSALFLVSMFLFAGFLTSGVEKKSIVRAQTPCSPSQIFPNVVTVCDFSPKTAVPGDTISVSGSFMGDVVQISNADDGSVINIDAKVNSAGTLLTFDLPVNMPVGIYNISSVISSDKITSGTVNGDLVVTAFVGQPPPPPNYPPPPPLNTNPVVNPPPPASSFSTLISWAFNYAIGFVGIAVFVMIMWAGFLWITSGANPGNIATAKRYITNAILGAILLFSAYVILYTINPELVGGVPNFPGLGSNPASSAASVNSYVAFDEMASAASITSGCVITTERQDYTAIDCPPGVTISGTIIDPVISTSDVNANNQIGATTLQNNGNNGAGRKIIILDTGYNYNHPELSSSYLGGKDFVNNDLDPMDDNASGAGSPGHGSHVAGIITADGINGQAKGVAPQTGIISGKILGPQGEGNWSKMVNAIYWAVNGNDGVFGTSDDFKADAINISIGGGNFSSICDNYDDTTKGLAKAIKYAKDNGVLVIIAAGNTSGNTVSLPGCIDESLTVGAVNSSDGIASFSGRGSPVDVVAPGTNIYSALLGNIYGSKNGTSMATPVVSGLAALIKSANPSYSAYQLEQTITTTACDLGATGKDNVYGWGRVTANPGSCSAPPPPPPPGSGPIRGSLSISPSSCTKSALPGNPNCDLVIDYTITGITSPTSLTLRKNNYLLQNIQCNGGNCTGQFTDLDPNAGTHQYTINLPSNAVVARTNGYVFTRGNIISSFNSCSKRSNPANFNCDVSLNITATGISPGSVIVTKDGANWRVIRCSTSSCATNLTDPNPADGIHTYALVDSSNNGRLGRATVTITTAGSSPQAGSVTLCTDINFGGTCEVFSTSRTIPDLRNTLVNQDTVSSMRVNVGRVYLCQDINYGGLCQGFGPGNYSDLTNYLVIGNDTASSMLEAGILDRVTLCSNINFQGTCEIITANDSDLSNNIIGNDNLSSIYVDTTDVSLHSDFNFGGIRQDLVGERYGSGVYPDLGNLPIGNDTTSSIGSL